jgi:hypothetical protein
VNPPLPTSRPPLLKPQQTTSAPEIPEQPTEPPAPVEKSSSDYATVALFEEAVQRQVREISQAVNALQRQRYEFTMLKEQERRREQARGMPDLDGRSLALRVKYTLYDSDGVVVCHEVDLKFNGMKSNAMAPTAVRRVEEAMNGQVFAPLVNELTEYLERTLLQQNAHLEQGMPPALLPPPLDGAETFGMPSDIEHG